MYRYQNCEELLLDLKRALVDPQGGFISNGPKVNNVDETVVMDTQEIARVQNRDYDGEDYDDPDESYDDEEYDDDSYDRRNRREDGRKGKKEEVDPQMKKVTKILMIVVAVIVAIGVIFGKHSQRRTSDISQQVRSLQTNMKKARLRNRIQNQEKK